MGFFLLVCITDNICCFMKSIFILVCALLIMDCAMAQPLQPASVIGDAEKQTAVMLAEIAVLEALNKKRDLVSPRTLKNDSLKLVAAKDWTSGFFPGQLWFLYEFTGKDK